MITFTVYLGETSYPVSLNMEAAANEDSRTLVYPETLRGELETQERVSEFVKGHINQGERSYVSTLSPMVLMRIRRLVAEGVLAHNEVAFVLCKGKTHATLATSIITVDEDGGLSRWPQGLFLHILDDANAIRRAARKNARIRKLAHDRECI